MRIIALIVTILTFSSAQPYSTLVDPFIGTDGHGHTFPGATAPFGMVQLSPDTRVEGWDACGGYHYSDSVILGFSHTHLSGTGCADYGDILLMPSLRRPDAAGSTFASSFRHRNEAAAAGFYHVVLNDGLIDVDLTASTRVGVHRYRFPQGDTAYVLLDLKHGIGPDVVLDHWATVNGQTEVTGYRRSRGWAGDQQLYFCAQFSLPILSLQSAEVRAKGDTTTRTPQRNVLTFLLPKDGRELLVKVALSSVSAENARLNLRTETPGWDFDAIAQRTAEQWNTELSKIDVRGGTDAQRRTFYTALYHTMVAPNTYSDVDGRYRGRDNVIHTMKDATRYTVFSLWDTFRALHPLLSIIDPVRTKDFIATFLAQYDEAGLLPVWELSSNETYCMIGFHSVPVIADAAAKGIRGFDLKRALKAMKASAEKDHFGLKDYRIAGYVPGDKESESVSKTLEYAYDDWCIARMAELAGDAATATKYYQRSKNYRNVFDPAAGFMRGKKHGQWNTPFSPAAVSLDFTEANSWQYSFFVPHDVGWMMELYGGPASFVKKLDELFTTSSQLEGRQQSDITGLIGQYAHGNEPSHHMAYLYTYAGAPSKTQERVRQILDELYTDRPDGLAGNEDCGQMSAWYVMSAMGLYQVAPGRPEYVVSAPLFDTVIVRTGGKKPFIITSSRQNAADRYIQHATVNKKELRALFISHKEVTDGATLSLTLGGAPSSKYDVVTVPKEKPVPFTVVPTISAAARSFRDSIAVAIMSSEKGAVIHYTLDGSIPTAKSTRYTAPIVLKESATLRTIAVRNTTASGIVEASYVRSHSIGTVSLRTKYSEQYMAGGDQALVDGVFGVEDFRVGNWQGFQGNDLEATIDLGSVKPVTVVSARFLQDNNAWIFFPTLVRFEISENGDRFRPVFESTTGVAPEKEGAMIRAISFNVYDYARYIRVKATNIGTCPPWHKGAGNKAWLFSDEIEVKLR